MKLHEKFLAIVKKYPDAPAISCKQETICYSRLDRCSDQLAQAMINAGFQKGQRAAICLEKSIEAVICMLATLKAEGIYVPIDTTQPEKRVNYILDNCRVSLVFCRDKTKFVEIAPKSLKNLVEIENSTKSDDFFSIDEKENEIKAESNDQDLVFILYTSGSTGVPKGVKISRENAQVFVDWCLDEMDLKSGDVYLNLAGFHFDLSVFDIYASLSTGAHLIIFPSLAIPRPEQICTTIEQNKVTVVYAVPSLLTLMATSGAAESHNLRSIRYLLFAGEVFPVKYLRQWIKMLPETHFYNLYGPTETNVCTYYKVENLDDARTEPVPIGIAVSGAKAYALNDNNQPIGPGEMGELIIGGPCVTPGYWNYEDARNSENHKKGIHATGDLVILENDQYLYKGRVDHQVKWKGFRIELGEIETVLTNHPKIEESATVISEEENPRLVAFLGGDQAESLSTIELKTHCSKYLARYMIPQVFKKMPQLPKNSNGKIDRIQLKKLL